MTTASDAPTRSLPDLVVPARYCGPPRSGNGGWSAGALADLLARSGGEAGPDAAVTVTLRMPPPLDTPMPVTLAEGHGSESPVMTASHDGAVVATATRAPQPPRPVAPVSTAEAAAAETAYPGLRHHPFDTCFACGTAREEGDGLRVFPGPVGSRDVAEPRVAARWTPHSSVADEGGEQVTTAVAWAALDCIGGWAGDLEDRMMVLGRMTAVVARLPRVGEEHVVVGAVRGVEGRKTHTAATLHDASGEAVAWAEHTWIAVDPADFR